MLKMSYTGCLGPSLAISAHFTLKMCATARDHNKVIKNSYFRGSRSFKVIDVDKYKKPVTSARYDKQHVCTYLQPFSY